MSRCLKARLSSKGEVIYSDKVVSDVDILSEGNAESEGVLVLDKELIFYLASSAKDIKKALIEVSKGLSEISTSLDKLDNAGYLVGASGAVPGPPLLTLNINNINNIRGKIDDLKDALI